jgi:hypothetical protein
VIHVSLSRDEFADRLEGLGTTPVVYVTRREDTGKALFDEPVGVKCHRYIYRFEFQGTVYETFEASFFRPFIPFVDEWKASTAGTLYKRFYEKGFRMKRTGFTEGEVP